MDAFMTCMDIERVSTHTMLGVVVNDGLMATDHVNHLLSSAARLLYALLILRSHGTPTQSLYDIFRATVIAKLTYCFPAWAGSCSHGRRNRGGVGDNVPPLLGPAGYRGGGQSNENDLCSYVY